jgi:uncharacterized membrane protein (DUF485 family)
LHSPEIVFRFAHVDRLLTLVSRAETAQIECPINQAGEDLMPKSEVDWAAIMQSQQFRRVARQRRNTIVVLGVLAAVYYFSIPALIAWAPAFFTLRIAPGVNLGLVFVVSQYPFGGLLAYAFMRRTAEIDRTTVDLAELAEPAIPVEKQHAF